MVLKAAVLRKEPRLIAYKNTVKMTCIAITLKFIYHKCDCGINVLLTKREVMVAGYGPRFCVSVRVFLWTEN